MKKMLLIITLVFSFVLIGCEKSFSVSFKVDDEIISVEKIKSGSKIDEP